jgi:hypothetical protein
VNAHVSIKKKPRQWAILTGGATFTFDQTMLNHRIKGDLEALEADWIAVCGDMNEALRIAKPKHELDAA